MINPFKYSNYIILFITALTIIGCKRQQIIYYEIEEEDNIIEQVTGDIARDRDLNMNSGVVPLETINNTPNPNWVIPEEWLPGKPSTVRRGSFSVMGSNNQDVDISVTTFPGDVGGELMNINRWRQQIGLSPISIDSLDEHIVTKTINGMTYRIVDFSKKQGRLDDNYPQRTIVAIANHEGNTWFFKMTGDVPLVAIQEEIFIRFMASVRF